MDGSGLRIEIDSQGEVPLYVQVKNQIRLLVEKGVLKPGAQLPTVRQLALDLGINANTVHRVYAELEYEGYLTRQRGVGTFAASPRDAGGSAVPGKAQLAEVVRQLKHLGYSAEQIIEMVGEVLGKAVQ